MLSCVGRLAGIVAPFAGAPYIAGNSSGVLWLGAGGIWLAAVMMVSEAPVRTERETLLTS
jgi:hypothetical protein